MLDEHELPGTFNGIPSEIEAAVPFAEDKLRDILMRELRNMYVKDDWLDKLGSGRPQAGDLRIEEVTGRYAEALR